MCGDAYHAESDRNHKNKQFHHECNEDIAAAIMNKNKAPSAQSESLLVQHERRWSKIRYNNVIPFLTP